MTPTRYLLAGLLVMASAGVARAQEPWSVTRAAASYDRCFWTVPGADAKIQAAGNLAGKIQPNDWFGLAGWVEYEVEVPHAGWYELLVTPDGGGVEYFIDGQSYTADPGGGKRGDTSKVANFWLTAGAHAVRVQRMYWTGFGPITSLTLRECPAELSQSVRVAVASQGTVIRRGDSLELRFYGGGPGVSGTIDVTVTNTKIKGEPQEYAVSFPQGAAPTLRLLSLPCSEEGFFRIEYSTAGQPVATADLRPISFQVVDARPVARLGGDLDKTLLQSIDCVTTPPDYVMGGETAVVEKPFGSYRESGDIGYLEGKGNIPRENRQTSFFAYRFTVPEAQQPYLLEFDYPDDALRTFLCVIREASTDSYPLATGPDTGGEYPISNQMQTMSILFWPHTTDLRAVFLCPHTGRRAAASKVRIYRINGELPLLKVPATGGRSFGNWYEEGSNYLGIYGARSRNVEGITETTDRWARAIAYMGGDLLSPTVAVYQMQLYPAHYNVSFSGPGTYDYVRLMLLKCEKYGEKFIADFHPEARDLSWPYLGQEVPPNVLVSREGKVPSPPWQPRYSPLFPANQDWYVDMVGEFVDRYQDSPALLGVSLRLMSWANPGLNNWHGLDWGYDDYTIAQFAKEMRLQVPGAPDDPGRFKQRYDWIMAHAREKWITWRCDKIVQLYTRLRDRVRESRKDLTVYSYLFGGFGDLRQAGIDVARLNAIDGVCIINAMHGYGRRQWNRREELVERAVLTDPAILNLTRTPTGLSAYLFGAGYFEATGDVAWPEDMGFPEGTKRYWISGVCNPGGRIYLERYALAMAEGDASLLMDGGNAYTLGQEVLRGFLSEYRALPPVHFTPRADARDPVAVWELKTEQGRLFYAVNRLPYPATVTVQLTGQGRVTRLATGEAVPTAGAALTVKLQPFELLTYRTTGTLSLARVGVEVDAEGMQRIRSRVSWLEGFAAGPAGGPRPVELKPGQQETLSRLSQEAKAELAAGHLWRANSIVDQPALYEIFQASKVFPPEP